MPTMAYAGQHQRLIVVSNRLPMTAKETGGRWHAEPSTGGLASAMNRLLAAGEGIWIGWPGDSSEKDSPERRALLTEWEQKHRYFSVDLPPRLVRRFYDGYSNETLWPLFHEFPTLFSFKPEDWEAYRQANQHFRDVVLRHIRPGDLVWVHDYHLMLLPEMLREAYPDAAIGFFLHIPFPASDILRLLPRADELLQGVLGSDYVAFHTHTHLHNFRRSVLRVLGKRSDLDGIDLGRRAVRFEALPIGIDPDQFVRPLYDDRDTQEHLLRVRRHYASQRLLLSVDRLDYTKGIPQRLRAYRRFLNDFPEHRGHVSLVQVAVPSRERVPAFQELAHETDELVGQINGQWSTPEWTPVIYLKRALPRGELIALYSAADVALVTPLNDGMNLVAKEYIASKQGRDGVLVLSEFAGVAEEMPEALRVNPYDAERTAEAIARALSMESAERRDRAAALFSRVSRNNVFKWGERFITALERAAEKRRESAAGQHLAVPAEALRAAYIHASRRLIFLDYDGTLTGFTARPQEAVPSRRVLSVLRMLADNPENVVVLTSGRRASDLDRWFGAIRGLWLSAEHGGVIRAAGSDDWWPVRSELGSEGWKERIRPVLEHFADRTPGSHIEDKELSLVWHYRASDPDFGEWIANELVTTLESALADTELCAVHGKKTVEVKFVWATKAEILSRFDHYDPDFILALGDDQTDEDLFAKLPDDAWTIKVGPGTSRARFRLPAHDAVHNLLESLGSVEQRAGGPVPPEMRTL